MIKETHEQFGKQVIYSRLTVLIVGCLASCSTQGWRLGAAEVREAAEIDGRIVLDKKGVWGPKDLKWKVCLLTTKEVMLFRFLDQPLGANKMSEPLHMVPLGSAVDWDYFRFIVTGKGPRPGLHLLSSRFREFISPGSR